MEIALCIIQWADCTSLTMQQLQPNIVGRAFLLGCLLLGFNLKKADDCLLPLKIHE
jgi:hypothetical protein